MGWGWEYCGGVARGGEGGQDGEEALEGQQVHGAEGGVNGEGSLGQQRSGVLKQIRALYAAVQIQVHVPDEARLVAEIQHALREARTNSKKSSSEY